MGQNSEKPVSAAIQSLLYPLSGLSIQTTPLEFRNRGALQNSVKCFEQVQVDGVSHSSIHQYCNPVVECQQICQARFTLSEATFAVPSNPPYFPCALVSRRMCSRIFPGTEEGLTVCSSPGCKVVACFSPVIYSLSARPPVLQCLVLWMEDRVSSCISLQ